MLLLTACSDRVEWKEEVAFSDGRVVLVDQVRRCDGGSYRAERNRTCIAREAWMTLSLPELSSAPIHWHSDLVPLVLNTHRGALYVVAKPYTTYEFRAHGKRNPPYHGYRFANGQWVELAFDEIPVELYPVNLLVSPIPRRRTEFMSLAEKNSYAENHEGGVSPSQRRIDPKAFIPPN
jgi:hypothetical protein